MGEITLTAVRHGEPEKGQDDPARRLTERGQGQVRDLIPGIRKNKPLVIITSSAVRGQQSGLILQNGCDDPKPEIIVCADLYRQERGGRERAEMFATLGPGPLSKFLEHPYSWAIREFGEVGANSVRAILADRNISAGRVVLVGHDLTLPAVMWALCGATEKSFIEQVAMCEGGLVSLVTKI